MTTTRGVVLEVLAAGFRRTLGSLPILLAVPTLFLYFAQTPAPDSSPAATATGVVVFGCLIGLLGWMALVVAMGFRSTPESVNRRSFDDLSERMAALAQNLENLSPADDAPEHQRLAWRQAKRSQETLDGLVRPGVAGEGWATGESYVSCWTELHRAEANVLLLLDNESALAEANRDQLRLSGSSITTRAELTDRLAGAIKLFGDPTAAPPTPDEAGGDATPADSPPADSPPADAALRRAREIIVMVHREVADYVDSRYDGLVRLANTLRRWRFLLGLVVYGLFVIAIFSVDRRIQAGLVESFAVYFLIGAGIGAANEVRKREGRRPEVDDYGVSQARYLLVPSLAGGAACGAAFVFGLLVDTSLAEVLSGDVGGVDWSRWVISVNPALVIVAAIFGLAPSRLFGLLDSMGDSLTSAVSSAKATEGGDDGEDA